MIIRETFQNTETRHTTVAVNLLRKKLHIYYSDVYITFGNTNFGILYSEIRFYGSSLPELTLGEQ